MLDVVSVPFSTAIRLERWDAPAGRYFTSYTTRDRFRSLAGHPVIDEFASLSSPVFLAPRALLGKLYDAGISLGHRRDPEMGLDLGWPPLCVGLDLAAPALPPDWQEELLAALSQPIDFERPVPPGVVRRQGRLGSWRLAMVRVAGATVLATTAPLLPRQLDRMCEVAAGHIVVAIATGNRLERRGAGEPHRLRAVSEDGLDRLLASMKEVAR